MKAVIIQGKGDAKFLTDLKEPSLRPTHVKAKVIAVALNPSDWKHIDYIEDSPGRTVGCDFSGIVEEIGSDVKTDVKKGDKIYGFVHGSNSNNHEDGCFSEHTIVKDGLFCKVPPSMSMEDAATLPAGVGTVGQALYQTLKLPLPTEPAKKPFPILIYGGSSATGTIAIQFAKLSGLKVITTASKDHFEWLKSLGADAVFDYKEPDVGQKIRAITENKLQYVLDTISVDTTFAICAAALSSDPELEKKYAALQGAENFPRDDVKPIDTNLYTALGEEFSKSIINPPVALDIPAVPVDYEFIKSFYKIAEKLVWDGKIIPHPKTVKGDGLGGILDGLQEMREGKVRGSKLVYRIEDTA